MASSTTLTGAYFSSVSLVSWAHLLTVKSPTAGGLLTDRVTEDSENILPTRVAQGRMQYHKARYVKPEIVNGLKELRAACLAEGISVTGASTRWLAYHSKLEKDDAIILGASKVEQVDDSVAQIAKGPLPETLVVAFEHLWQGVKDVAPVGY
jgi:aflatoxin B1 aldehyde reductase